MTIKRVTFLQELLEFVGLGNRLHLEWISSAEAQKFVRVVTDFTEQIKAMGPSPITEFAHKVRAFVGPRPVSGTRAISTPQTTGDTVDGKGTRQRVAGGK